MTQLVFEELRAPAFYTANSAALALYASRRSTGVVLESGGESTRVMGVRDGLVLPHTVRRASYAGDDLTEHLRRLLCEKSYMFSELEVELVRDIKEKLSYVADEMSLEYAKFAAEKERGVKTGEGIEREYELPDGQVVTVGMERFSVPEALFEESRLGLDDGSLKVRLWNSIHACDADLRGDMMRNIVVVCMAHRLSLSIGIVCEADSVEYRLVETLCSLALPTGCRQRCGDSCRLAWGIAAVYTSLRQRIGRTRLGLEGLFLRRCRISGLCGYRNRSMRRPGLPLCIVSALGRRTENE
jgi:hypothetical protein